MKFSLLSYNLRYDRARANLDKILAACHPDILCLQEIITQEEDLVKIEKFGYKMADYSSSFIKGAKVLGVATFYNPKVFFFKESKSFDLPRSLYEFMRFVVNSNFKKRTVLKTELHIRKNRGKISLYNLHLPPFATNNIRDKQIRNTFEDLHLTKKASAVIAGDFNYPYGRKKFENMIKKYGLAEATSNIYYTLETKILKVFSVRLKLDYVLFKNIRHISTEKIEITHSDHFPILSYFEL